MTKDESQSNKYRNNVSNGGKAEQEKTGNRWIARKTIAYPGPVLPNIRIKRERAVDGRNRS